MAVIPQFHSWQRVDVYAVTASGTSRRWLRAMTLWPVSMEPEEVWLVELRNGARGAFDARHMRFREDRRN
jgi:hypothetical protein